VPHCAHLRASVAGLRRRRRRIELGRAAAAAAGGVAGHAAERGRLRAALAAVLLVACEAPAPPASDGDAGPIPADYAGLDVNPASPSYGQTLTLSAQEGRVIVLYLADFG
jgi:hypothetical protein